MIFVIFSNETCKFRETGDKRDGIPAYDNIRHATGVLYDDTIFDILRDKSVAGSCGLGSHDSSRIIVSHAISGDRVTLYCPALLTL